MFLYCIVHEESKLLSDYCLYTTMQAIEDAMTTAFNNYPNQRSPILTAMSLLNSHLSNIPTSPIKFIIGLEPYIVLLSKCQPDVRKPRRGKSEQKLFVPTHSVELMNKHFNSDSSSAPILQQMLALLMQVTLSHMQSST